MRMRKSCGNGWKKLAGTALLTAALAAGTAAPALALDFKDVSKSDWFYDATQYVSDHNIMNGYGDGTYFGANAPVTREQVAQIFYNYLGNGSKAPACPQKDVDQSQWYAKAVNWCVANKVMSGFSNTQFGVGYPLTREQAAIVMANAVKADTGRASRAAFNALPDHGRTDSWAVPSVAWAVDKGIINGVGGSGGKTLQPLGTVPRSQMAQILKNTISRGILDKSMSPTPLQVSSEVVPLSQAWLTLYDDGELVYAKDSTIDRTRKVLLHGHQDDVYAPGSHSGILEENCTKITSLCHIKVDRKAISFRPYWSMKKLRDISGLAYWDVSDVTSMAGAFRQCSSLADLTPIANWDVSNVKDMGFMFAYCTSLKSVAPLKNWKTSSLGHADRAFGWCTSLTDISGVANWDISNITGNTYDVNGRDLAMFQNCTALEDISPLANWDMSHVKCITQMFMNCASLKDLRPIAHWNTSSITYMDETFAECTSLSDVSPLVSWDMSSVKNVSNMFRGCKNLTDARVLNGWNLQKSADVGIGGGFSRSGVPLENRPDWSFQ